MDRYRTRLREFTDMTAPAEAPLSEAREALAAIDTNGPTFAKEQFSTPDRAALAQLENVAIGAEAMQQARKALAIHLHTLGMTAEDVMKAAHIGRNTLFRWKRETTNSGQSQPQQSESLPLDEEGSA